MYRYNGITIILIILIMITMIVIIVAAVVRKDKVQNLEIDSNGVVNIEDVILKRTYYSDFYEIKITSVIYKDGTLMQSRVKWNGTNDQNIKENFKVMRKLNSNRMSQIMTAIEKIKNSKLTTGYSSEDYGMEIKENQADTKFISVKYYEQSAIDELNSLISDIVPN